MKDVSELGRLEYLLNVVVSYFWRGYKSTIQQYTQQPRTTRLRLNSFSYRPHCSFEMDRRHHVVPRIVMSEVDS